MKKTCPYCLIARIAALAMVGVFISWLMSTEWFLTSCSGGCAGAINTLLLPASTVGSFLGSGEHGIDDMNFAIGVVVQFWVLWSLGLWGWKAMQQKSDR